MIKQYLFLLGSGRRNGNTEQLARHAARYLPAEDQQQWLHLLDLPLSPFVDIRHDAGVYPQPEGYEKILFEATLTATDIVLVSPLYWYSVSASMKLYLDYWSAWLRVPGADFRKRMAGKTAWTISANSDEDGERLSEPLVKMLQQSAEYMHMHWGGALIGSGNRPGDVMKDERVLNEVQQFWKSSQ